MRYPRTVMSRMVVATILALAVQRIAPGIEGLRIVLGSSMDDPASEPGRANTTPPTSAITPARAPAGEAPRPDRGSIHVQGRVVDDETGDPVEFFALETGRGEGPEPSKTSWDTFARHVPGSFTVVDGKPVMTRNPHGQFSYWNTSGKFESRPLRWLRVVADGYEPHLINDRPFGQADFGRTVTVTVRLKRGRPLVGQVVDHTGRPAAGAKLFLIRPSGGTVKVTDDVVGEGSDTGILDPSVTRAVADEQGRFRLTGVGDAMAIGISAPTLHLWTAPIPALGDGPTFRLPEPATIRIPYAIEGDEPKAEFRLQLMNGEDDRGRLFWVMRSVSITNRGEAVLHDATPGTYGLWRMKSLAVGDYRRTDHVEYRTFSVERGGVAVVDFTRERGGPIAGMVSGPGRGQARMIFVGIEPADASAARGFPPRSPRSLLDIVACGAAGRFQTARIPPGQYVAYAVGYRNRPRYGPFVEMIEPFDFSGSTTVTVSPDGNPTPVQVEIAIR
jgi:hypothetical protein